MFYKSTLLSFIFNLLLFHSLYASDPIDIDYKVICNEQNITQSIVELIDDELKKYDGFEIDKEFPDYKLFIFLQKDENDRINPDGYSIAIFHTSKLPLLVLALKTMKSDNLDEDTKSYIADLVLNEEGIIKHLNVAHIDAATEENFEDLVQKIIKDFMNRYVSK